MEAAEEPIALEEGLVVDSEALLGLEGVSEVPEEVVEGSAATTESDEGSEETESDSDSDEEYAEIQKDAEAILQKELEELNQEKHPHTPHEIISLPPVSPITVQLSPSDTIEPLGAIHQCMDNLIVIRSNAIGDVSLVDPTSLEAGPPALEEGSLVCLSDRTVLGEVHEVFGPVREPYYSIRFNSSSDIPAM